MGTVMQVIGFGMCLVGVGLLSWGLWDLYRIAELLYKTK